MESQEQRLLKVELTKYMLATEKLARSLEESGLDAQSCVEDLGVSLDPDLPNIMCKEDKKEAEIDNAANRVEEVVTEPTVSPSVPELEMIEEQ